MPKSYLVFRLPRHFPGPCAHGTISVECPRRRPNVHVAAELIDFSRFGARMRTECELETGEQVLLHLRDANSDFAQAFEATIRWRQLDDDGRWSAGCVFADPISWETFGELFLREFISAADLADTATSSNGALSLSPAHR